MAKRLTKAAASPPEPKPSVGKLDTLLALLRRPTGATLAEMTEATSWQPHSVRGAMAGSLKKKGFTVTSEKADGVRVYSLPPQVQP